MKKLSPAQRLQAAFVKDYNDNELQTRYDGFVNNKKQAQDEYNPLVIKWNALLEKIEQHESHAIRCLKDRTDITPQQITLLQNFDKDKAELHGHLQRLLGIIKEKEKLIYDYELFSDHKLFTWWTALTAAGIEKRALLDFRAQYGKRIF